MDCNNLYPEYEDLSLSFKFIKEMSIIFFCNLFKCIGEFSKLKFLRLEFYQTQIEKSMINKG